MKFFKIIFFSFIRQTNEFIRYPNYIIKSFFYTPITYILPLYYFLITLNDDFNDNLIFNTLLCMVFWQYISFSLIETINIAKRDLNIGIIEVLFTLPVKHTSWILGNVLVPNILFAISNAILILIGVIVFKFNVTLNILKLLTLVFLVFFEILSFSVLIYLLSIMFKKILNILLIIMEFIFLIAGVIYPIDTLPVILKILGLFAPFSYIFEILRGVNNNKFVLINGLVNILYFILITILYKKILKGMKKNGNLSTY